jgi:hypothetical protein
MGPSSSRRNRNQGNKRPRKLEFRSVHPNQGDGTGGPDGGRLERLEEARLEGARGRSGAENARPGALQVAPTGPSVIYINRHPLGASPSLTQLEKSHPTPLFPPTKSRLPHRFPPT